TMLSMMEEDLCGFLNSNACAAVNSSIAMICSRFSATRKHLVAAFAPMLTWSSCPLEETMESTEAGVHNCLFWLTMDPAVYCGLMNPELRPALATRKGG